VGTFSSLRGGRILDITLPNAGEFYEYDLMTMYYVYQERLSCMTLNPQFAKKYVIEHFEDTVSQLAYEDLLVFLRTNGKILGIYVKALERYSTTYDIGEAPKELVQEVKELERLIRKRLLSL